MSDESMVDFSRTDTGIFWSVKNCPIPRDDYVSATDNIRLAVYDLGYRGYLAPFEGYGEDGEHKLLLDMINFVISRYPKPVNLMVLSKKISEPSEFFRVLRALRLRSCNILLVEPPDSASESMFETAESVINCTKLLHGGDPRINKSESSDDSDSDSDK